jgi:xylan 1,4-beta-xylosidase
MLARTYELAERHQVNLEGSVTWAFEFEDQPCFDGFRTLATNGIDKPVLNFFRMMGLMGPERIRVDSPAAARLDDMLQGGVRGAPDLGALGSRGDDSVTVMVWNYHDDDVEAAAADVELEISGLAAEAGRVLVRHYRIDHRTSNAYAVWKSLGSPQSPTPQQYAGMEAAGQLQLLSSPEWRKPVKGSVDVSFPLPRQAVSLIELSW